MHGECTDNHVATLRRRYGEKRLQEAALRRAHLNYQRISIGHGPGSGRVKFLLAQMHQTYYFGFSESACILAGTLLEQGLTYRLGAALDRQGPLPFSRSGEKRWLQTREDLLELELVDMLELAREERVITEGRVLLLAHEIRWIRNMVVHEKIPLFQERDDKTLELKVAKSRRGFSSRNGRGKIRYARIILGREEVADLVSGPGPAREGAGHGGAAELTAYFCVSRTRMVLRHLFQTVDTEEKNKNESGGSLLLFAES
jgi:hypothetical protein